MSSVIIPLCSIKLSSFLVELTEGFVITILPNTWGWINYTITQLEVGMANIDEMVLRENICMLKYAFFNRLYIKDMLTELAACSVLVSGLDLKN